MEDKLRQILDNLDEKETDELLKKQYEWKPGLNEERIWEMVFDKTGVSSKARTRRHIMYGLAGLVACLAVLFTTFFTLSRGNDGGFGRQPANKLVDKGSDTIENTESPTGIVNEDEDKDDKKDKDDKDKDEKNDSKKPQKKPNSYTPDRIASGKNNNLVGMSSKDIEKLLDEYACEIDMTAFSAEYNNVDDMLMDCDIVVKGTKKQSLLSISSEENIYNLMAGFEVSTVLWNNTDEELDDEIIIKESIKIDEKNKSYTHVNGYIPMTAEKDYILFLKFTGKSYHKIAGGVYGKIPLDSSEEILHLDGDYEINQDIADIYSIVRYARERFENYEPTAETPSPEDAEGELPTDSDIVDEDSVVQ